MIAKVIDFFKSKGGAILAALIGAAAVVTAIFARGRKQGALEQKVAQEEKEARVEGEIHTAELAEHAADEKRHAQLVEDLVVIEEVADGAKAHPPATLTDARAEQTSSRRALEQLRRAGLVKR